MNQIRERRGNPRIFLDSSLFRLKKNGKIFKVVDIHESGFCLKFLDESDAFLFPVATEVSGILSLIGQKMDVAGQVVHSSAEKAGIELKGQDVETQRWIESLLTPAKLGATLRPFPASPDTTLLFKGALNCELKIGIEKNGAPKAFCMRFGGMVLASDPVFREEADAPSIGVDMAKAFLLGSGIPDEIKSFCLRRLEDESQFRP